MIRKGFLLAALSVTFLMSSVQAQEVTVTGMGIDKDSAIRDASRQAVEQVVGTFIDSRTLMENLVIQLDEVYKKSQSFIKNIRILDEGKLNSNTYRVRANIDVDTSPNVELMNQLTMMMKLNDPRIAVIILQEGSSEHEKAAETTLNSKLLEMGFSHVVDAGYVIKLKDSNLLRAIYDGRVSVEGGKDNYIDHLILGESKVRATRETVPDFYSGKALETPIVSGNASLNIKILKYDTGDLISNFTSKGLGRGTSGDSAIEQALETASTDAAKQLENAFKKMAAKTTDGIQVNLSVKNYATVEKLADELRAISEVDAVYIRSHDNGKAILEIETSRKPHEIVRILRQRTKLNIFVEQISDSSIEMAVS